MGDNEPYSSLDRSFKSTCRIVLGGEVGELSEYASWLSENIVPNRERPSAISGKPVYSAVPHYPEDARFLSIEEIDTNKRFEPLGINSIKDIDLIIEALSERFVYCGNTILSNSKDVAQSSNIQNSFHVLGSNFIYDGEHIAYSSYSRGSKYLFGVVSDAYCSHIIRGYEIHKQARGLETWRCYGTSDSYYSCGVENSQDVMFSFALPNKKYVIGNLELGKSKYLGLKAKLLAEIREELIRNRRLPSLMEILAGSAKISDMRKQDQIETQNHRPEIQDMDRIEQAFQNCTEVVLGKPLQDIRSYKGWLTRYVPKITEERSAASGRAVHISEVAPFGLFRRNRLVGQDEAFRVGGLFHLEPSEIDSFSNLKRSVGKIGFLNPEAKLGTTRNIIETPVVNQSIDCFHTTIASLSEQVAYCYWPRNSKYIFGSNVAFSSNFCINSHHSLNLSRAFEVDSSNNSSDIYFSHNCENVRDGMFCFNTKNLRNAIGNAVMEPDRYRAIKTALLEQITDELESGHDLDWSIFSIGAGERGERTGIEKKRVRRSHLWHQRFTSN